MNSAEIWVNWGILKKTEPHFGKKLKTEPKKLRVPEGWAYYTLQKSAAKKAWSKFPVKKITRPLVSNAPTNYSPADAPWTSKTSKSKMTSSTASQPARLWLWLGWKNAWPRRLESTSGRSSALPTGWKIRPAQKKPRRPTSLPPSRKPSTRAKKLRYVWWANEKQHF